MTGLRFKVGELAILAVVRNPLFVRFIGQRVTIMKIKPRTIFGTFDDYQLDQMVGDFHACVADFQLQKIDPPAEPASLVREFEWEIA